MYSVKRNGEVVALFMEESDAEKFRKWKVRELWDELIEERVSAYITEDGCTKDDISDDVVLLIDGMAEVEAAKAYVVVEE